MKCQAAAVTGAGICAVNSRSSRSRAQSTSTSLRASAKESLGMNESLAALAIVELPRRSGGADAGHRRHVEHSAKPSVVPSRRFRPRRETKLLFASDSDCGDGGLRDARPGQALRLLR